MCKCIHTQHIIRVCFTCRKLKIEKCLEKGWCFKAAVRLSNQGETTQMLKLFSTSPRLACSHIIREWVVCHITEFFFFLAITMQRVLLVLCTVVDTYFVIFMYSKVFWRVAMELPVYMLKGCWLAAIIDCAFGIRGRWITIIFEPVLSCKNVCS